LLVGEASLIALDKPRLRQALKRLRQVPFDSSDPANAVTAPLEILEFLAVVAGLKPVFLLGRGFDDPSWISGVSAVGSATKLHVISGPKWDAEPGDLGLPYWYAEVAPENKVKDKPVTYICKLRAVAETVRDICASRQITMNEEARLLGYPLCCVQHHYIASRAMNSAFARMLQRYSKGDIDEMKRIVQNDIGMTPETPEELADARLATELHPAPFTSFNLCPSCVINPESSGRRTSATYAAFARAVDRTLADEIEAFSVAS
jgi:hypothetical protein